MQARSDTPQPGTVGIGEAAAAVGVSASTLRAWEAAGLSEPERDRNGRRRYSEAEIARLRAITAGPAERRRSLRRLARDEGTASGDQAIPQRLRWLRSRHGLSVRQAAARCGLSPSYLSAVENGSSRPSVAALLKLAASYGVTIMDFYRPEGDGRRRLARAGSAERLQMGSPQLGVALLTPHGSAIELHLFELQPGATSGGAYTHEGDEFWYVLSGALGVWLNGEFFRLGPGDCLSFASTDEHRFENLAEGVTVFLGANTPSTF